MLPRDDFPEHWSAEQALALYEWLGGVREHLWAHYQTLLAEQYCNAQHDLPLPDPFDIDDDMPF